MGIGGIRRKRLSNRTPNQETPWTASRCRVREQRIQVLYFHKSNELEESSRRSTRSLRLQDSPRTGSYNKNKRGNNGNYPNKGPENKQVWLTKVQQLLSVHNYEIFVKTVKTLAYSSGGLEPSSGGKSAMDVSNELLPMINSALPKLDAAMISDLLWSLGRLGFRLAKVEHRSTTMRLLQRLCESENPSPRQVCVYTGSLCIVTYV